METWFLIIVTGCLAALLKAFISLKKPRSNLPPGPRRFPLISSILWLRKFSTRRVQSLRSMRPKYGPIISLPLGSNIGIFIYSHSLAYQALIQNGAIFADRPKPLATHIIMSSNQHSISSAHYGPKWRVLRRNLTSQILHPSKVKAYSPARKWVLDILISQLNSSGPTVKVVDHFQFAMFCLLVLMCFGDKLDEKQIREIETAQRNLLVSVSGFQVLNIWPWLTKIVLHSRWEEFFRLRKKQADVFIPHIRARKEINVARLGVTSYVDTLLTLEVPDDTGASERKMTDKEMVSACSEFLNAGIDTASTALQWIMANLVKYPDIQSKLFQEIKGVVGEKDLQVDEDDLSKMPYLKAVVLEGLRRHPPGHFVLPHSALQEVELGGYTVPKNAIVNFAVAEMGWDPEVWEDPMQFKPERFLSTVGSDGLPEFDITGSREIKMIPFGAGRRICPASGLAILHLEYFVANLVWRFRWEAVDGEEVDLSEKAEFTVVMKHPLKAHISPRLIS